MLCADEPTLANCQVLNRDARQHNFVAWYIRAINEAQTMSGGYQTADQLTAKDLQHVVAVGARNVGSPKLRQAAHLLAMISAADVHSKRSQE